MPLNSNKSIKTQVVTFMVLGISIMATVIGLVTTTGVNQQSRELMLKNAFQINEGLAKQTKFSILSGSKQNAQEAMIQVQGFQSVLAARLLLEDQSDFITVGNYPNNANNVPYQTHQTHQTQITIETDDYWLIKSPIKVSTDSTSSEEDEFELDSAIIEDQIIGYAEVVYSKEHLKAAQTRVAQLISMVGIISVFILGIVLRFGLLKLFKPLGQLADTMHRAKKTGDHLLAKIEGAKEIRDMASSYNMMMKVLDQQEKDLLNHRDQLEKEVTIRTKELVLARDSALIASQHKSEFMANMSHELRTPIQSIIGYGELVIEELELEGNFELIDDMEKISKNSQRLLTMINSLLDLAKIEAGKIELNYTEMDLADLQINLIDTIEPLAQKNHNKFSISSKYDLNQITTDKQKLEQVLLNLLSNACKFTENGQITLSIFNDNQFIHFEIIDTGIGLSDEQQRYIFDEFRQVDSSQSRKFSGTGLGLAISKRFVELMQGKITVFSELNKGATFSVLLPIRLTDKQTIIS